ncbi:hypothetical protein Gotur_006863, partial [Gossypium turneri]
MYQGLRKPLANLRKLVVACRKVKALVLQGVWASFENLKGYIILSHFPLLSRCTEKCRNWSL